MPALEDFTIGQPFRDPSRTGHLVDKREHTRKDGTPSGVLVWQVKCTHEDCAAVFEVSTGLNMPPLAPVRKHCEAHKLSPAHYLAIGRQKVRERRQVERAIKKQAKAAERQRKAAEKEAQRATKQATLAQMRREPNPLGHPRRKLSDEDVAEIRRLSAEGLSSKDLAVVFPVSDSAVRNILRGARR